VYVYVHTYTVYVLCIACILCMKMHSVIFSWILNTGRHRLTVVFWGKGDSNSLAPALRVRYKLWIVVDSRFRSCSSSSWSASRHRSRRRRASRPSEWCRNSSRSSATPLPLSTRSQPLSSARRRRCRLPCRSRTSLPPEIYARIPFIRSCGLCLLRTCRSLRQLPTEVRTHLLSSVARTVSAARAGRRRRRRRVPHCATCSSNDDPTILSSCWRHAGGVHFQNRLLAHASY